MNIQAYSCSWNFWKAGWDGVEGRGERLGDVQRIRMEWRMMELRGLSAVQCSGLEWSGVECCFRAEWSVK